MYKRQLLNLISNRIFPTSGSIKLGDQEVNTDQTLDQVFLIGEDNLYYKQVKINQMFDLADVYKRQASMWRAKDYKLSYRCKI